MTLTEKSGHMAWCALMALALAREEGGVQSPAQENLFLTRWLATALKQRRFPREVTPDIQWLLKQGRQLGIRAKLTSKLNYLWHSCAEPVSVQSDLYRLTFIIEQLKSQGWVNAVVSDGDWGSEGLAEEYNDTDTLLVRKSALTYGFSDGGKLIAPVEFLVTGNLSACIAVFQAQALPGVMLTPDRITIQP